MSWVFWASFGVVAYTYAGYPAVMAVLARVRPRPWRRVVEPRSVSVVMAVHNGAHLLGGQIEHLLSLPESYVREVIVVSDGSTDGTAEVLTEARGSRLRSILLPERVGKASALNAGMGTVTSEIVLFIDIRPRVAEGAIERLMSSFADPTVGCVAGELVLDSSGLDAAASAVSGVYWRYEQWIRNCEAAFDSPVGVYGGFYAARRALLSPFPPGIVLDDMFQPLSIVRQGYRSVLDREAVVLDAWPGKVAGEFQRKVRTLAGNFELVWLAPWTLSFQNRVLFQLVSHKLLRLVVPYCFVGMLVSASWLGRFSGGWRLVAGLEWAGLLSALLALRVRLPLVQRYAAAGGALLVLNAAAVAGLWRFLFSDGPLWKSWAVQGAQGGRPGMAEIEAG